MVLGARWSKLGILLHLCRLDFPHTTVSRVYTEWFCLRKRRVDERDHSKTAKQVQADRSLTATGNNHSVQPWWAEKASHKSLAHRIMRLNAEDHAGLHFFHTRTLRWAWPEENWAVEDVLTCRCIMNSAAAMWLIDCMNTQLYVCLGNVEMGNISL